MKTEVVWKSTEKRQHINNQKSWVHFTLLLFLERKDIKMRILINNTEDNRGNLDYLLNRNMSITTENLSNKLNIVANQESWMKMDSSEQNVSHKVSATE